MENSLSGDLAAYKDKNGYLYIIGRKKDQIMLVAIRLILLRLKKWYDHLGIIECAVCSVKSNFSEVVALGIVVENQSRFEINDLIKVAMMNLNTGKFHKLPKSFLGYLAQIRVRLRVRTFEPTFW